MSTEIELTQEQTVCLDAILQWPGRNISREVYHSNFKTAHRIYKESKDLGFRTFLERIRGLNLEICKVELTSLRFRHPVSCPKTHSPGWFLMLSYSDSNHCYEIEGLLLMDQGFENRLWADEYGVLWLGFQAADLYSSGCAQRQIKAPLKRLNEVTKVRDFAYWFKGLSLACQRACAADRTRTEAIHRTWCKFTKEVSHFEKRFKGVLNATSLDIGSSPKKV